MNLATVKSFSAALRPYKVFTVAICIINSVDEPNYFEWLYTLPPTQNHSLFRNFSLNTLDRQEFLLNWEMFSFSLS